MWCTTWRSCDWLTSDQERFSNLGAWEVFRTLPYLQSRRGTYCLLYLVALLAQNDIWLSGCFAFYVLRLEFTGKNYVVSISKCKGWAWSWSWTLRTITLIIQLHFHPDEIRELDQLDKIQSVVIIDSKQPFLMNKWMVVNLVLYRLHPQQVMFTAPAEVCDEEAVGWRSINLCFDAMSLLGMATPELAHPMWNDFKRALSDSKLQGAMMKLTLLTNHGRGPWGSGRNGFNVTEAAEHLMSNCNDEYIESLLPQIAFDLGCDTDDIIFGREEWMAIISKRLKEALQSKNQKILFSSNMFETQVFTC